MLKQALLMSFIFLAGHMSSAFAATATYYFNGTCDDCVLTDGTGLIGTLVLEDYIEGTEINLGHFVSFSYVGSDLVVPYVVDPPVELYVNFEAYAIAGAIGPAFAAPYNFQLDFDDGLRFKTTISGDWYTCAPGAGGYYSGTCDDVIGNDYGTGTWSTTPGAVPIPAAAWLFGSALLGLAAVKRKKA